MRAGRDGRGYRSGALQALCCIIISSRLSQDSGGDSALIQWHRERVVTCGDAGDGVLVLSARPSINRPHAPGRHPKRRSARSSHQARWAELGMQLVNAAFTTNLHGRPQSANSARHSCSV
ncbi:hypothetical protein K491DRAFT_216679 [Lophiostoma macrostomum CBS 122681]|uniref:Uncharacterized protein n=1 Tax=Lophiostoma macrostomum CBS 122681 TaxID=1314788 RepID=A0A6A6TIA7_9PLEO|nr:hypothetical protein K491DRAFT_216679 [Lophiostoma macrostomum CBS 122681]